MDSLLTIVNEVKDLSTTTTKNKATARVNRGPLFKRHYPRVRYKRDVKIG